MSPDKIPTLAIVGPTNVGKSTLFNRLTESRRAIVCDRPGVTVDRHEMLVKDSVVGDLNIVDTGGVGPEALRHPLGKEIERAASEAVQGADLVLFLVDGTREAGVEEFEISNWLRRQKIENTSVWVVANKMDAKKYDEHSFYVLGYEKVLGVSAEHGEGIQDLWDEIAKHPKFSARMSKEVPVEETQRDPRIIVLGRPNAGKSTLLNSILGSERHVVSEVAGTTRDAIETEYRHQGQIWKLCDTAGLRQPGRLERGVEWVAREKLKDVARNADLAIVLYDSTDGITDLDAAISGMALDFGLSVIGVFNKWDLMRGDGSADLHHKLERTSDLKMDFMAWCPTLQLSGLTGKGVPELLKSIKRVLAARTARVQTAKLNEVFEKKLRLHSHPVGPRGQAAKFYYLSQVKTDPPEFVLFSNLPPKSVHFSFRRYLANTIRKEFGFEGTPIKLHFKTARGG